jgi:AAA ATPase domain
VGWPVIARSPVAGARRRDDLLALAERRLDEVAGGRGQLLFVAGEAGIGKTRLLAAVTDAARLRDLAAAGGDRHRQRRLLVQDLAARAGRLERALGSVPDGPGTEPVRAALLSALAAAYMLDRRLDEAIATASGASPSARPPATPPTTAWRRRRPAPTG